MDTVAFYIFAAIAVLSSLFVVAQRNPMHSVMLLITSFGALAGLYVLLDAPFTAVTQIIRALSRVGLGWLAQGPSADSVSSVALIGNVLFTRHAFAFEATSILIL